MKRYYIVEGDKTTVGGIVKKHTGAGKATIILGKTMSYIGDKVDCPVCKSEGTIKEAGSRHSRDVLGLKPALNDDLCVCKCHPSPKLINSQTLHVEDVGDDSNSADTNGVSSQNNLKNNLGDNKKHDDETCACNREVTLADLKKLAVGSTGHLEKFIEPLNKTLKLYNINTCIRKSYFIAQTFLESSEYKELEEKNISSTQEISLYNGYKGRGLIQLTGPSNYQDYGTYKGVNFEGVNRLKVATPQYAIDSAGWFWDIHAPHNLNDLADKNDLIGVSAVINGGFNHFDSDNHGGRENRKAYLLRAFDIFKVKNCKNTPSNILQNLDKFELENSIVYNRIGETFGWGLWHDATKNDKKRIGCTKSIEETQKGYKRFLELTETHKSFGNKSNARYYISFDQAVSIAKNGIK